MIEKSLQKGLELFEHLPDAANVSPKVTAAIFGRSERWVRYHPDLKRIYTSQSHYTYNVGEIRKLARQGRGRVA